LEKFNSRISTSIFFFKKNHHNKTDQIECLNLVCLQVKDKKPTTRTDLDRKYKRS